MQRIRGSTRMRYINVLLLTYLLTSTPPWLLMRPVVNYSLYTADKDDILAEIHKYRFYQLCDQYADYCSIYTNGSKAGERVASAIVYKGITKSLRLPDLTSIFRAELYALFLATDVIRWSKLKKLVISQIRYLVCKQLMALTLIMILCRNLLKNTQFRQSKEKPSLYVGFQVISAFLEMRKPILLQKLAFTALKSPASELLPRTQS